MKPHYKKVISSWAKNNLPRYENVYAGYHRGIRTWSEARQNHCAVIDARNDYTAYKVRRCRNVHDLDPWNDYPIGRNYGRSWKDYTKNSKQWMGTPEPVREKVTKISALARNLLNALEELGVDHGQ